MRTLTFGTQANADGIHLDHVGIIRRLTPETMRKFHEIMGRKAPERTLCMSADVIAAVYRKRRYIPPELAGEMLCGLGGDKEMVFEDYFHIGLLALGRRDWITALNVFYGIANDHFAYYGIEGTSVLPRDIAEKSAEHARTICRAWVLAQASDYAKLKLRLFDDFVREGRLEMDDNTVMFSAETAVLRLGLVGQLVDIAPIHFVGRHCGDGSMHMDCDQSSTMIMLRGMMKAIPLGALATELGLRTIPQDQLEHRLSMMPIFVGLGRPISFLPAMRIFSGGFPSPLDDSMEKESLENTLKYRVEREFLAKGPFGQDYMGWAMLSARFMLEEDLARTTQSAPDGRPWKMAFTEKGKELLARMVSEMMKIEIKPA